MKTRLRLVLLFFGLVLVSTLPLWTMLGEANPGFAQDDEPPVSMPMSNDRLVAPPMPANPTQADEGAHVYWLSCMACHGDRGQGLTEEWRSAWAEGDQNCWQSKCHAANHPVEGFLLPHTIPPVIGEGILTKYPTANDLHAFLKARMPWHQPGSLPDEQYWQLTAYLARANGFGDVALTPANASAVRLAPETPQSPASAETADVSEGASWHWLEGLCLVLVLAVGAAGVLLVWSRRVKVT